MMNWKFSTAFSFLLLLVNLTLGRQSDESYIGIYQIPHHKGFTYAPDRSFGYNDVFEQNGISVYLIKEPLPGTKATLNSQIYAWLLDFYNIGFYQEKGSKSKSYRQKFLEAKTGHFTRFGRLKNLDSKEKVYLLFYTIDDNLYRIIVYANSGEKNLPKEAKEFIEAIRLRNE